MGAVKTVIDSQNTTTGMYRFSFAERGRLQPDGFGKEMAMEMGKRKRVAQPLFHSVSDDGTRWLFVVGSGGGWAITRNGEHVEIGTGDQRSVHSGVEKFLAFIHSVVTPKAADNAARKINRIGANPPPSQLV
jgi:hypothetical protein